MLTILKEIYKRLTLKGHHYDVLLCLEIYTTKTATPKPLLAPGSAPQHPILDHFIVQYPGPQNNGDVVVTSHSILLNICPNNHDLSLPLYVRQTVVK
ncbi:unnamed protein product [Euphydryas editha]|uniref:Uncharacterized protein n=1 Tax=Euphydryas editha TaxID=104508 RepID=A0AAU9TXZ8_EUPED|nr:unnamed protein product [Euphydryas editha]